MFSAWRPISVLKHKCQIDGVSPLRDLQLACEALGHERTVKQAKALPGKTDVRFGGGVLRLTHDQPAAHAIELTMQAGHAVRVLLGEKAKLLWARLPDKMVAAVEQASEARAALAAGEDYRQWYVAFLRTVRPELTDVMPRRSDCPVILRSDKQLFGRWVR
jgi:hypothetical protein